MHSNLKERAKKLKTDIPALFLALKDKETPILAKVFAAITVLYALSPIDLIPDFIPIFGYLDDVILLPGMIALTIKLIPQWKKECVEFYTRLMKKLQSIIMRCLEVIRVKQVLIA